MNNKFTCEVCGAESEHTLSKITIRGAYGTFFDNEKIELATCPECCEGIMDFIMSRAKGDITTQSGMGEGFYY